MPLTRTRMPSFLAIARLACRFIRGQILSSNQDQLSLTDDNDERPSLSEPAPLIRQRNEQLMKSYEQYLLGVSQTPQLTSPGFIMNMLRFESTLALNSQVGNCHEISAATFIFLHRCGVAPLDIMAIRYQFRPFPSLDITPTYNPEQQHRFVVINRQANSDIYNPLSWGEQAIICDPWSDLALPVHRCADFTLNNQDELNLLEIRHVLRTEPDGSAHTLQPEDEDTSNQPA